MTLYVIRPSSETHSIEDEEVLFRSTYGWEYLEQAVTLWRLTDRQRADDLAALMERISLIAGHDELRIETGDLREFVRLLAGVDDAIVAAEIVDQGWRVPAEQLEELARQVPAMDLKTERPLKNKRSALGEVMINARSVRNFFLKAIDAGCVVVLS